MVTPSLDQPLSLRQTQFLLQSIGRSPRKNLGQNFLVDKNIVFKFLELAHPLSGENVIEIGPGLGTLTRTLLGKNCRVFAIEQDATLYAFLQQTFVDVPNFHLIQGNALSQPLGGFDRQNESFKIIANLPYNISTPWLEAVLKQSQLPLSMTLMLQKETVTRLLSGPGSENFSAISIFLASAYRPGTIFPVARTCIWPMPRVDSVILHLERLPIPKIFHRETKLLIRNLFTQRRKQSGSLFKIFLSQYHTHAMELLQKYNFPHSVRPGQLPLIFWQDLDQFIALSAAKNKID
ncbi:MAG: 16S rRNA (adenine(1518)-N(6)/adenine(1519)-N(6))-dimethyltransferase RsmA [Puniceicoccales bacterium]|jgi:16S rRNA (adenine1518-N6/adenine1519-N6)-dimethyltransferase|nr:16S rRNA (adenine(1518)-N(6)/adenine(1519)-N(6))-dimethyltransferase RsmA [Puniceicoccales bacterium]